MRRDYHRILLLFVDGVGLAPASDRNPFAVAASPRLEALLGGGLTAERATSADGLLLRGLDATLGVPGLPQSATGQTALFTGLNGAAHLGRHATGLPGAELRRLIESRSIFRRAVDGGLRATFANAYTGSYLEALAAGHAPASVTTCAVAAAGLRWRTLDDLAAGRAVTWDIERDLFGRPLPGRRSLPAVALEPIGARAAGAQLGALAAEHDLTVFESFLPDLVGHGRIDLAPAEVVRRIDELLAGVIAAGPPETTVVLTSDHGNFEDSTTKTHTRAPVPLLAVGPAAGALADLESIVDLGERLLAILGGRT